MPSIDLQTAWCAVLDFVRVRTEQRKFETWFSGLRCLAFDAQAIRIALPNDFHKKWLENNYLGLLREGCFEVLGEEPRIELTIVPPAGAPAPAPAPIVAAVPAPALAPALPAGVAASATGVSAFDSGPVPAVRAPRAPEPPPTALPAAASAGPVVVAAVAWPAAPVAARPAAKTIGDITLNPQYTFDEFVIGPSNRLAHAAALAVCESPGQSYNPLFLHGGVGLGKTHLLQAICHSVLTRNPGARVVYLSAEKFVNQYVELVAKGVDPERFRQRYRDADLLLVDDIHFLSSKKVMQEEFFHTFNALYNGQKQIILASDSAPQEIPDLEARLVSRFKWGLVAEVEPPHYETKVAIIQAKAKARGRELPADVVDFLANALDSNIRELEGAVTKVIVLAGLQNQKVDVPLCRAAVKELAAKPGQVNLSDIMTAVATHYHLKVNDLLSEKRSKSVALPRQIAMYLGRMLTHLSLQEIGGQFGGRDHTTVLYAEAKIRDLKEKDPEVRALIERLTRELQRG
jgi:chromosomal replication initiator protein